MNKLLAILLIFTGISIISCSSTSVDPAKVNDVLEKAEANSSSGGRKILETSRSMISNKEIIVGGCWDYINTVYDRAGYISNKRVTIFKSKLKGPYAKAVSIEPGDWLYFVNHSYRDTEHSAIFVAWIDEVKKVALMISYLGENKKKPALYKKYTLSNIYNIIRAQD